MIYQSIPRQRKIFRLIGARDHSYGRIHHTSTCTDIALWFSDIEYGHRLTEQKNAGARRPLANDVLDVLFRCGRILFGVGRRDAFDSKNKTLVLS